MPDSVSLIALVALVLAPAAPSQKFDLVCEGTSKSGRYLRRVDTIRVRYSVDLEAGLWSKRTEGYAGSLVKPIAEVTPSRYNFAMNAPNQPMNFDYVDRQTGKFESAASMGGRVFMLESGTCQVGDFSGFPQPKL